MIKIREDIYGILRSVVDFWSTDAGVSHALSDLFKRITCLPHDITLIPLPAGPLLELVCFAVQRHLTAAWLSLATILISQLNPPPVFSSTPKISPPPEAHAVVVAALPILLEFNRGQWWAVRTRFPRRMILAAKVTSHRIQTLCKSSFHAWTE
ncbi:hypothetical protein JOM56_011619 [Amanita muscaria]